MKIPKKFSNVLNINNCDMSVGSQVIDSLSLKLAISRQTSVLKKRLNCKEKTTLRTS